MKYIYIQIFMKYLSYIITNTIFTLIIFLSVEQVKGSPELKQKIISAAKEARKSKYYMLEMQHNDCIYISEKFGDHTNRALPQPHGPYSNIDRKYKLLQNLVKLQISNFR